MKTKLSFYFATLTLFALSSASAWASLSTQFRFEAWGKKIGQYSGACYGASGTVLLKIEKTHYPQIREEIFAEAPKNCEFQNFGSDELEISIRYDGLESKKVHQKIKIPAGQTKNHEFIERANLLPDARRVQSKSTPIIQSPDKTKGLPPSTEAFPMQDLDLHHMKQINRTPGFD